MRCPFCRNDDSRVVDSRTSDDGASIRRRRECQSCSKRFSTIESANLYVSKRNSVLEPFSRDKIVVGVRKACQGRPVTDDQLAMLAQQVEDEIRSRGQAEIDSQDIGQVILPPLRQIDEIAYLRFASVYESFETLQDFEKAIARLREEDERKAAETAD